jgi:adenylate cyclase
MPVIQYLPDQVEVEVENESTILRASLRNNIPHTHVCGGNARCSTCRIMVMDGLQNCLPRNEKETILADRLAFSEEIRLACQTKIVGDVLVRRLVLDKEDIALVEQPKEGQREGRVGLERKIAILFSDVRNFTAFAEAVPPYDVIHILNRYFYEMDHIVEKYGGYVDNHIGDGIMALFGVDDPTNAAMNAIIAGLEMLAAVRQFRPYVKTMYPWEFQIGIGLHYGEAVVGTLGSINKKMTAVGDAVNFAARIESANKDAGTEFLISESTFQEVAAYVDCVEKITLRLKGKQGEHTLYEVLGLKAGIEL